TRELDSFNVENNDKPFEDAILLAETHASDAKIRWIFQFWFQLLDIIEEGHMNQKLDNATAAQGYEFGTAENSGQDSKPHYDKSISDFIKVVKVICVQHSVCAVAINTAAGGMLDDNLHSALKTIPIVGLYIVEYTIKVHVIYYLGNGVWVFDEVDSCTLQT
ncbi:10618_t:CDS:2, partial [Entrophospora sp. SA101]